MPHGGFFLQFSLPFQPFKNEGKGRGTFNLLPPNYAILLGWLPGMRVGGQKVLSTLRQEPSRQGLHLDAEDIFPAAKMPKRECFVSGLCFTRFPSWQHLRAIKASLEPSESHPHLLMEGPLGQFPQSEGSQLLSLSWGECFRATESLLQPF